MSRAKRFYLFACVSILFFVLMTDRPALAADESTYKVRQGDTLIDIAVRHGVSVDELAAANGLSEDAWVFVGQQLVVPATSEVHHAIPPEPVNRNVFVTDIRVPDPLPQLPVLPQEETRDAGQTLAYARVIQDDAPVYAHPREAAESAAPKRRLGVGFIWVSVEGHTAYEGRDYYQINPGEYLPAEALSLYSPSAFRGVQLAEQPERSFAWILQSVQPLLMPAGEVNLDAPAYHRYDLVQIFATEQLGDQVWYLVGRDKWINQIYVGKVTPSAPPEGLGPDAAWVEVDAFEQTLAAYVGDRMVYATLVSSGLPGWDTPPGLFKVWLKVTRGKMSGGYNRPDYYFLEDVPWSMYFNRDIALHTAYWHDGFGYRHSHGCVNLAPQDAKWLFDWAPDDLSVWVH